MDLQEIKSVPSPNYVEHKERDLRIRSAVTAIKALLPLDLYLAHKKELLSTCLWKITEADGKFKTRYRSIGSLTANSKTKLQHEHVVERSKLIARLLNGTEDVESVVEEALGCVVTADEHKLLTQVSKADPSLDGWKRYARAGIRVFDLKKKEEAKF